MRVAFKTGHESDALERRTRRFFSWKAGTRKAAKRSHNRRARRAGKLVEVH